MLNELHFFVNATFIFMYLYVILCCFFSPEAIYVVVSNPDKRILYFFCNGYLVLINKFYLNDFDEVIKLPNNVAGVGKL